MILFLSSRAILRSGVCTSSLLLGLAAVPLAAADARTAPEESQPSPASSQTDDEAPTNRVGVGTGEIVVRAQRLRGQLDVDTPPLLELNEEDIASEGVTSIQDLVTQINNQTGSARGRSGGAPVILINGIRVGSFREFFQYPPEALARVEVFPEEVAQRFGFSPDQRVINLILKENYASRELEFEFEGPSRGGYMVTEQQFGYLQIKDGGRFNFNFQANDTSLLTESERDLIQTPGSVSEIAGDPDQAEFRSLVNDSRRIEATVSWAKAFLDSGTSVSANLNYNRTDSLGLSGLNSVSLTDPSGDSAFRTFGADTPLERRGSSDTFSGSGSFSKPVNSMVLTSTFDASLNETATQIDRRFDTSGLVSDAAGGLLAIDAPLPAAVDAGFDTASNRTLNAQSQTTLRGPIAYLPGGEVVATFDFGADWRRNESSDTRTLFDTTLERRQLSSGVNLVIPITSRREGFADALGSFSLTLNAGLDDLSDFGLLGDYSAGLNWAPTDRLNLSANYIYREVAPSLAALGNPLVTTFNTPVFDFSTGQTVLATVTQGGNPDLLAETQRDWRFAANWELPFVDNTRFTVEYIRNRSDDVTSSFPQVTTEIEAAFPGRVIRDGAGQILEVDGRSVTFSETRSDRLQFQLSTRGSIGGDEDRAGREGRGGGRGGPPEGSGRPAGGPPAGAGGPPSAEQREQFMQFRTRLCADDGLAFLTGLIERIDAGEDVAAEFPGFDPQRLRGMLTRVRGEDGKIDPERLAAFRERLCSMDPSGFGRGGQQAGGQQAGSSEGQGPGGPMREAFAALRTRICGDDGAQQLARIVAAIEAGEDISQLLPGMDPQFLKMMLDRARGEDGKISPEALEQFRERICSGEGRPGGGQAGQGGGGGPLGGGNPFAQGRSSGWRYFVSLTHTIELANEILIAPGLAPLDQLDGDPTGSFGFPRNNARLEAGLFGGGTGFRLSGQYTGTTRIDGSGLPGSTDLFFNDLVTFDLRIFTNLGDLFGKDNGVFNNLRVSLRADNIFDARRKVTDENGDTPINYQPFLIDPTGRFVGIDIRKLF